MYDYSRQNLPFKSSTAYSSEDKQYFVAKDALNTLNHLLKIAKG